MASSPETAPAIDAPKKMDFNATGSPPSPAAYPSPSNSSSDSGPLPKSPPPTPSDPPPSPLPHDTPNASSPEKSPPSPSSSSSSSSPSSPRGSSSSSPSHNSKDVSFTPPTPPSSSGGSKSPSERSHSKSPPFPPSPTTPSSENSSEELSAANLSTVLGITFAVGVFLFLMIVGMAIYFTRKKKPTNGRHYHDNLGSKGGSLPRWQNGGDYNGGGVSPPPGAAHSPGGGWHQSPPGMMMSGEMSEPCTSYHGGPPQPPPTPPMALGFNQSTFTYDELAAATNGFSRENLLGQGGFGYVYKGVLPNQKEIAVKQLKAGSGQGEREFRAEVEIISRVHHRHLVSLVGFCIAGTNRMLVYEFVPNDTLEHHLHVQAHPTMDWPTRLKIAIGSAKGLAYLHEDCHPRIIHRDIKTANILLDNKFEAMVADFGLAKLSLDTNTHVSTRVMGTFGYLAPEYASSGKLTEKSDVFSFGVMLLELITGRRPVDNRFSDMDDSLVDWARPIVARALAERNLDELVDRRLGNNYEPSEMARMAACAAASVRHSARRRPRMSQIVRALEGVSLEDLNEGVRPGQSSLFNSSSDLDSSSGLGSGSYSSNMRRFRQIALGSVEFSNNYSGIASEYGHNSSNSSSSDGSNDNGGQRKRSPNGL